MGNIATALGRHWTLKRMLYHTYQAYHDASEGMRAMARAGLAWGSMFRNSFGDFGLSHRVMAALELASRVQFTHTRPDYGIKSVLVGNRNVPIHEEIALSLPFCDIIRFAKKDIADQPKMLVVAPLSGHFATLLRKTIETLSRDHDVYITDWKNARDVPMADGGFGFDDYVDYIIKAFEAIGPKAHLLAVCQPCVQALVAVALMSEDKNPATPLSMTLMAGPIDTRINPSAVNELAMSKPIEWFEQNLITSVPEKFLGGGRRVYPGFIQLIAFMSMNLDKHANAHRELYNHIAEGRDAEAAAIKTFYDEYFAVLDLTEEFYIETVQKVFQDALLAKGELICMGRKVNPAAIKRTALLTVEGERDDICSVGQTAAAHEMCKGLRPHLKRHHLQPGVGHYGTFSGKKWEGQIYPQIRNLVLAVS